MCLYIPCYKTILVFHIIVWKLHVHTVSDLHVELPQFLEYLYQQTLAPLRVPRGACVQTFGERKSARVVMRRALHKVQKCV